MPNWCSNHIQISGDKESIQKIKEKIEPLEGNEEAGIFETLIGNEKPKNGIPIEDELDNFFGGGLSLYGCKWDVSYNECSPDFSDEAITISPNTAWSPPRNFCIKLSEMYGVDIVGHYEESGNDFSGRITIKDGEVQELLEYPYYEGIFRLEKDEYWDRIDFDLECSLEDGDSIEKILEEHSYITKESDKKLMRESCEEILERIKENKE